ncbi:mechanosensitive ion channel domain-containing protein [Prochlorococcus sp. P1344]|uniref:mechanosensitive ion channel domain-containing protein n=1 Tax=unclassified Prochlorococcus TaxID=2627481 RepID=UPI001F0F8D04|nr:mechanosensitive ion channel domain-containing protein [Prochlorococcus sp. P1344]
MDLLDPSLIQFPRDGVKAFGILVVIGLLSTLLSWKKELRQNQDSYVTQMLQGFGEKDRLFLFDVVQKTIGIAAMLILCLEVMHLMGISPAVLVTAGGVGAVALGFGAKGIVSNSLSGLSFYISRPFIVSDFIDIPSEDLSRNVEYIG